VSEPRKKMKKFDYGKEIVVKKVKVYVA